MTEEWKKLYERALAAAKPFEASPHISAGSVGAAVLTSEGSVFTGICIDTDCSLGMCAERNALSTMLTGGEYRAVKICSVYTDGTVMPPCGACREFMMQLGGGDIEVLIDSSGRTVRLSQLMPEYPY